MNLSYHTVVQYTTSEVLFNELCRVNFWTTRQQGVSPSCNCCDCIYSDCTQLPTCTCSGWPWSWPVCLSSCFCCSSNLAFVCSNSNSSFFCWSSSNSFCFLSSCSLILASLSTCGSSAGAAGAAGITGAEGWGTAVVAACGCKKIWSLHDLLSHN